jgi:hypothetical protein
MKANTEEERRSAVEDREGIFAMGESVDNNINSNSIGESDDKTISNASDNASDNNSYSDNNRSVVRMKFTMHMKRTATAAAVKCT